MRDDICTIPISEIFEENDGCPICRMRNMLENRMVDYILGAAMMEPDVRQESNRLGFCATHLKQMMRFGKRLPLALVLETHLDTVQNEVFKEGLFATPKKSAYNAARIEETCFVCDKVQWGMERLLVTLLKTYAENYDFRETFRGQEYICLPHYRLLLQQAPKTLIKKQLSDFTGDCKKLAGDWAKQLRADVHDFTKMFDYRSGQDEDADFSRCKDAIERTYLWMTTRNDD